MRTYPAALPRTSEAGVDLPVLLFTCGIAAVTSIFFGLAQFDTPAQRASPWC